MDVSQLKRRMKATPGNRIGHRPSASQKELCGWHPVRVVFHRKSWNAISRIFDVYVNIRLPMEASATVLLIANYSPDQQKSMTRVADLLESLLRSAGFQVRVLRPAVAFGRWMPRTNGGFGKWIGYIDKFILFPWILISALRGIDLVHVIDHSNAIYLYWLGRHKTVVTCNDMLAVRLALGEFGENRTSFSGKLLQRCILSGLRRAKHLVCISDATRKDVLRLTRKRATEVSRTYLALGETFEIELRSNLTDCPNPSANRQPESAIGSAPKRPYILHVGGDTWYKNRSGVLNIYAEVRARLGEAAPHLLMVGPAMETLEREVTFLQDLNDAELAALYRGAELLLFPSLEEGFGWPVVEAQACGCPVVTTGRPPLTEAGGSAAIYLEDPCDAKSAAEVVVRVLNYGSTTRDGILNEGFRNAQKFTRSAMIAEYICIYRSLLTA
jgi:glycosyltransferase involved in cell wall biosynthesis